jgi:hypothetical protein
MFGHQDDQQQHDDNTYQEPQHDGVLDSNGRHDDAAAHASEPANPAAPPPDNQPGTDKPMNVDPFAEETPSAAAPALPPSANELLDIKQEALKQLSPLVGHLDQNPEEKFRTTMMMIQASDDQSLINVAYEAAEKITDEKAKAQALLDIVNEINYFTHQGNEAA